LAYISAAESIRV